MIEIFALTISMLIIGYVAIAVRSVRHFMSDEIDTIETLIVQISRLQTELRKRLLEKWPDGTIVTFQHGHFYSNRVAGAVTGRSMYDGTVRVRPFDTRMGLQDVPYTDLKVATIEKVQP